MLEKTKVIFKEDIKDMWIHYRKFRRNQASVLVGFQKFYLTEGCWKINFIGNNFIFIMSYNEEDNPLELDNIFINEIHHLLDYGFDVCYDKENRREFMISMDNFVEALLKEEYKPVARVL